MRYLSITCPQRALRLFSSVQHTLKRREFDVFKPHKYKSILWGPQNP